MSRRWRRWRKKRRFQYKHRPRRGRPSYRGPDDSKFANPKLAKRGPNGYFLCRVCGVEVKPPKITFCGRESCLHTWKLEHRNSYRRQFVMRKCQARCAMCNVDVRTVSRSYARQHWNLPRHRRSVWDSDHIIPLAAGGTHDESNLQLLCYPCHQAKSNEDDAVIAEYISRKRTGRR